MTRNGTLMSFSLNGAPFAGYSNLSFNWTGSQWTAGADYLTTSTRQNFYSGILREVCFYDGVVLTHPDIFPSNRVNSTYRVILKAHRDGVDALQEFDYTVPQRVGWDLQWDYNFNGGH